MIYYNFQQRSTEIGFNIQEDMTMLCTVYDIPMMLLEHIGGEYEKMGSTRELLPGKVHKMFRVRDGGIIGLFRATDENFASIVVFAPGDESRPVLIITTGFTGFNRRARPGPSTS